MDRLLRSLSIRRRLLGGMLVVSLLIFCLGVSATLSYRSLQAQTDELLDRQAAASHDAEAIVSALERIQRLELSVLLNANNAVEGGEHKARWDKEVAATQAVLRAASADGERARHMAEASAGLEGYAKEVGPVLQQVIDAKLDSTAGYAYAQRALPALEKARDTFSALVRETESGIAAERARAKAQGELQSHARLAGAVVVLGVFFGLMWMMARSISGPLGAATASALRIARGDLAEPIHDDGRDEVSAFVRALAEMQAALREVVGQVRASAERIQTASAEVASGNLDLSQRTEHTAGNLQRTAASLHQLTDNVRQSADSAAQATQLASSASQVAERGGEVVQQVVRTMDEINASSRKIADITGVIDGIAFQTNILALNAAVEAARAGEQGRGFAVVAGEVRMLAQRSAEAAKEIKALIGSSVERVGDGTRQAQAAGSTMTEIVGSVRRVNDIIGEITAAAGEQSHGIGEANTAVSQLDQMTQQNAALVEQSAAAAESLNEQSQRLMQVVGTFRLSADDGASAALAASTPRAAASAVPRRPTPAAVPTLRREDVVPRGPASDAPAVQSTAATLAPAPAAPPTPTAPAPAPAAGARSPAAPAAPAAQGDEDWTTF